MLSEEFKQLQKELKAVTQHIDSLKKITPTKTESLIEIEKSLRMLPPSDTIGRAIEEWRQKAQSLIERVKQQNKEAFNKILADFIREEQAKDISTREFDNSWRIGSLEIQLRREQSQVQIAYNQQIIVKWFTISSLEDIRKNYDNSMRKLKESTVPFEILIDIFWDSYEYLRWQQKKKTLDHSELVPLKNFFYEVQLFLRRKAKKDNISLPKEFTMWAFLYNLDLYRSRASDISDEKRLGCQTGSQAESARMGIVTNGLDAIHDYKTYCYIYAVAN